MAVTEGRTLCGSEFGLI